MKIPIYQVDAFTDKLFGGNPAAVCPLGEWPEDKIMQSIAQENNLAETAFFVKNKEGYELRWFTPAIEINLCGHATLAAAHVLFNYLGYNNDIIHFSSKGGVLSVNKSNNLLVLDFPATPPNKIEISESLIKILGKEPVEVYQSRDILIIFESEEDIISFEPDFSSLAKLDYLGVIISAIGNNVDFVSRFFAPNAGINEDSVTGSAHCTSVPYWSNRLNKSNLHARQLSERQGELFCEFNGDRVLIGGNAITYLIGEIEI